MVIFSPCLEFLTLGLGKLDAREGLEESMKWLKILSIGSCIVLMLGCNVVYTSKPIGEKPAVISSEDWEGAWEMPDGLGVKVKVVDEANGEIEYGPRESEDADRETLKAKLRVWGGWVFFNAQEPEHAERYQWGRIENQDGRVIILWEPDAYRFRVLVEEGILPGTVGNGSIILGDLTAEHMELITTSSEGVLFDWDDPMILFRIEK